MEIKKLEGSNEKLIEMAENSGVDCGASFVVFCNFHKPSLAQMRHLGRT